MVQKDFYTVKTASEETTFSERYLRDMIGKGKLKATKTGTVWFIRHEDLTTFIFSGETMVDKEPLPKKTKTPKPTKGVSV